MWMVSVKWLATHLAIAACLIFFNCFYVEDVTLHKSHKLIFSLDAYDSLRHGVLVDQLYLQGYEIR